MLPNSGIEAHLPDKTSKVYRVDAIFILSIVKRLQPDYFKAVVDKAHDVRFTPKEDEDKVATITMSKTLREALFSRPFTSRK